MWLFYMKAKFRFGALGLFSLLHWKIKVVFRLFYTLAASLGFSSLEILFFNPRQFTELEAWVLNMRT